MILELTERLRRRGWTWRDVATWRRAQDPRPEGGTEQVAEAMLATRGVDVRRLWAERGGGWLLTR